MAILNVTPDSFYAGSRYQNVADAGAAAGAMIEAGANILDVGGMSSRPGAEMITPQEEQDRVLPVIEHLAKHYPDTVVSCDTVYASTARAAVSAGAGIINDISAGQFDAGMFPALPELRTPYVLMHMPNATPAEMQERTADYGEDFVLDIYDFLAERVVQLQQAGVNDIIIDPGFGFGKTVAQNYELLKNLHVFTTMGVPVLAGVSRKSMIWRPLEITPEETLPATTALHLYALQQGASVLRVHDVAAAAQAIQLHEMLSDAPLVGEAKK